MSAAASCDCKYEPGLAIKSEFPSPPHHGAFQNDKLDQKQEGAASPCSCSNELDCIEVKYETKVELLDNAGSLLALCADALGKSDDNNKREIQLPGADNSFQKGTLENDLKSKHLLFSQPESRRSKIGKYLLRSRHCDFISENNQDLTKHEDKLWKCNQCDYVTNHRHFHKFHLRIHQIEKLYNCQECDFSSMTKSRLLSHRRKKHKEKDLTCPHCSYKTNYKPHLTAHIRQVHVVDKRYKCSQCDFKSAYNNSLKIHMMRHTGQKPHRCKFCDYSTNDRGHLVTHLRRHTGEKPYRCQLCDYSAADKANITNHERLHKNEQPFRCSECDFATHIRGNLTCHFKSKHAPEALRFKCSECDFVTHSSRRLKWHSRTHAGVTIYPCDLCEYVAAAKANLEQHLIRFHSTEKPHCCSKCKFRTAYKESLKRHAGGCDGKELSYRQIERNNSNSIANGDSSLFSHL
ncbi:hypothetical protein ACHWQZ_G012415 [Mnemiopsis leidyi]